MTSAIPDVCADSLSDVERYSAQIVAACRAGRMPGAALANLIQAAKREALAQLDSEAPMADPLISPDATIVVYVCDGPCDGRWIPGLEPVHPHEYWQAQAGAWLRCNGTPRERRFVDLAAIDRKIWEKRIADALHPDRTRTRWARSAEVEARAALDALLGPKDPA